MLVELNKNQVVKHKGKNAIIICFMNDGSICINQDGTKKDGVIAYLENKLELNK